MSTPPIRVPITAEDLTGPGFMSAGAKAQAFQSSATYSMREARGAAMLLSEEIGVKLNRHLAGAITHSQLLGSALSMAFPIVAAIGFISVVQQIPEAIKRATDFLGGFTKAAKDAMDDAIKANEKILSSFKTIAEGYLLLAELRARSIANQARMPGADAMNAPGMGATALGFLGPAGAVAGYIKQRYDIQKAINDVSTDDYKIQQDIRTVIAHITELKDKENKDVDASAKKVRAELLKDLHEVNQQAEEFWRSWQKLNDELDQSIEKLNATALIGAHFAAQRKQLAPWLEITPGRPALTSDTAQASEMYKIQTDLNYAYDQAGKILEQARTPLEKYSDAMTRWVELANQTKMSADDFAKGAKLIGSQLDKVNEGWKQFGEQIGRNLEQAALFGRSWSDALKAIMVDVAQLILKMTLLKSLESKYGTGGSGGGIGGFFTSLLGGFTGGHAGGGYIPPGMWGIVGEKGPELAFGGSSGSSIVAGGIGGVTIHIDARGADASVEGRIMRLLPLIKKAAVQEALAANHERKMRR